MIGVDSGIFNRRELGRKTDEKKTRKSRRKESNRKKEYAGSMMMESIS